MATIGPVTLTITRDGANAVVGVSYTITGSSRDVATLQPYREICRLVGDDDTAGDGPDDAIPGGTLKNVTTVFAETAAVPISFQRILSASALNEDIHFNPAIAQMDEIRAVVSLTPIPVTGPRSRESDIVSLNAPPAP
jgi:hypothetical protein